MLTAKQFAQSISALLYSNCLRQQSSNELHWRKEQVTSLMAQVWRCFGRFASPTTPQHSFNRAIQSAMLDLFSNVLRHKAKSEYTRRPSLIKCFKPMITWAVEQNILTVSMSNLYKHFAGVRTTKPGFI